MRVALALLPASVSALVYAQEPQTVEGETFVQITPIERMNPSYPTRALQHGNEGWVILSFVVSETGEVEEAMIEDSSGTAFEDAALEAVRRWRYTPATVNGKPVAQSMVKTRIVFALEEQAKGVTREFQGSYRKLRDLLDAGDYAAAKPLLDEMETGGRHNLYEDALFWALKYGYLEGVQSGDAAEKLRALELALGHQDDSLLPTETFIAAAQRMYVLRCRQSISARRAAPSSA